MTTTTALTARASGIAAAVVACAEAALSLPANDNAGLAWRLEDDREHIDDRAFAAEVIDRNSAALAPVIEAGVAAGFWRAYAVTYPRAAVRIRSARPFSRSVERRVRTLHAMLTAAGVSTRWG